MILTAITFLIILTILVLIHELGHFLVARMVGVRVEEFGLGLPPRIWGKKFGDTIYSLNWLPIGGFVRLAGEDKDPDDSAKVKPSHLKEYFWARSKKERSAILVAGVFMNFVLAVVITMALLLTGVKEPSGKLHVERVVPNSPAALVGLTTGDVILSVAVAPNPPKTTVTPNDLISFVKDNAGKEIVMIIDRGGVVSAFKVTPRTEVPPGEGPLGVAITDLELHKYPLHEAPGKALMINVTRARDMVASLGGTVWRLVTLRAPEADVAGPIGIAQVTGVAVSFGWAAVLEFASILSLNLAVLNVLPIPALDGGRLMFVFLEKMLGKKVRPAFERSTHQIGMLILLGLIVLVSINDILRLVRG
ncbi:site-2 protease family protein [Candidatus Gottesmanbacteria bacterium]|nr:site-2 protease family protein [Candidatus Gottesmanbacteria bacterium]